MPRRRRLLELTALAAAGLAGCLDSGSSGGTPTDTASPVPDDDGGGEADDTPAEDTPTTDSPTPTPTVDPANVSFAAEDGEITKCGSTCRTFAYSVENTGSAPAREAKAAFEVYTPNLDGDQVFEGDQLLGKLASGETIETTKDVDPGAIDAGKITSNDGNIGIRLTVTDQSGAEDTFTFQRTID